MAKGNYGVTSLGGSGGSGSGSGGAGGSVSRKEKGFSRIQNTFAKGGYLPGALEHGKGHSVKGVKSISDIANNDAPTSNDIFTSFRKK